MLKLYPDRVRAIVSKQIERQPFSGVVIVREAGNIVYASAHGEANRSDGLPNTLDTRFATASGSKVFTAVAVMQLIEAGKFTLETPLRDVLDIPYTLDPAVTVSHLLTHSSGLPDYYDEEELSDEDCMALWEQVPVYTLRQPEDYLPLFMNRPAKFAPGERFHYNNGAFVLLAALVQQQSGVPFPHYVKEHIFKWAGMEDAGYFRMDALPARTALGYLMDVNGAARTNVYLMPPIGSGDGGAYVTGPDWANFWDALLGHRLLSPAMTAAMLHPQIEVGHSKLDKRYGYGAWLIYRDGEPYEQYVVGADFGVGMISAYMPGRDVQFTILDNTGLGVWGLWGALVKAVDKAFANE